MAKTIVHVVEFVSHLESSGNSQPLPEAATEPFKATVLAVTPRGDVLLAEKNPMSTNPVSNAEFEQSFFAVSSQRSLDSGKALAALLIYLAAFTLALFLFVRGFRSIAYVTLFAVWAVLAAWLQRVGR